MLIVASRTALESDTLVADRYRVLWELGRGGFAITYCAEDSVAGCEVALKELLPPGTTRLADGSVQYPDSITHSAVTDFLEEARLLAKLNCPRVVRVLDAFRWQGAAFVVMELVSGAKPLSDLIKERTRLDEATARRIFEGLAEGLEAIHDRGYLHRDVKPSNVLITSSGDPVLIDFGSAREWSQDKTMRHTTFFTPGYAPIEQLSERGRRGPASDIYSLCATTYEMLTGITPPSATDRVTGVPLQSVLVVAPQVSDSFARAIHSGLELEASKRPQSIRELLAILEPVTDSASVPTLPSELLEEDATISAIEELRYDSNECPACGDLLDTPRLPASHTCLACGIAKVRVKALDERLCPVCRHGFLREVDNMRKPNYCPICKVGKLDKRGIGIRTLYACKGCDAAFTYRRGSMAVESFGSVDSELVSEGVYHDYVDYWLPISGRSDIVLECRECLAQFDESGDGRTLTLRAFTDDPYGVASTHRTLTRAEWTRVAAGVAVEGGNAVCPSCGAEYFVGEATMTLIESTTEDVFVQWVIGRRFDFESARWVAARKSSGRPGPVCRGCGLEFDEDGDFLRLVAADSEPLTFWIGKAFPADDWHRIARNLPIRADEDRYRSQFEEHLRKAVVEGDIEVATGRDPDVVWRCSATLESDSGEAAGELELNDGVLKFHSRKHRFAIPIDTITNVTVEGDHLVFTSPANPAPVRLTVPATMLEVQIGTRPRSVRFTARDVAQMMAARGAELPLDA